MAHTEEEEGNPDDGPDICTDATTSHVPESGSKRYGLRQLLSTANLHQKLVDTDRAA